MTDVQSSIAPDTSPLIQTPFTFSQRLGFHIKLPIFKFLSNGYFQILTMPGIRDTSILPTYTKVYPCQPKLTHRIFIPKSYKSGDLLPVFFEIHGGGFALGHPYWDDQFCSEFSNENKILVISLDYHKASAHPYPEAVQALIQVMKAILDDKDLPIDKAKVAVGGSSAGGALSLAVSQDDELSPKLAGVVAYYPFVDFSTPLDVLLASRPKDAGPDPLAGSVGMYRWGYCRPGQNLKEPQLSVRYASKEKLPSKIYFIGCEHDMLCRDAELMAQNVAGFGAGETPESEISWEKEGIKWKKILGEEHGFDVIPAFGEKKIKVQEKRREMHASVAEWLFRVAYA